MISQYAKYLIAVDIECQNTMHSFHFELSKADRMDASIIAIYLMIAQLVYLNRIKSNGEGSRDNYCHLLTMRQINAFLIYDYYQPIYEME